MKPTQKICEVCEIEYTAKRTDVRVCSSHCSHLGSYYKRIGKKPDAAKIRAKRVARQKKKLEQPTLKQCFKCKKDIGQKKTYQF